MPWVCQQVWPRGGAGLLAVMGLMVREGAIAHSPLSVREAEWSRKPARSCRKMLPCLLAAFLPLR